MPFSRGRASSLASSASRTSSFNLLAMSVLCIAMSTVARCHSGSAGVTVVILILVKARIQVLSNRSLVLLVLHALFPGQPKFVIHVHVRRTSWSAGERGGPKEGGESSRVVLMSLLRE